MPTLPDPLAPSAHWSLSDYRYLSYRIKPRPLTVLALILPSRPLTVPANLRKIVEDDHFYGAIMQSAESYFPREFSAAPISDLFLPDEEITYSYNNETFRIVNEDDNTLRNLLHSTRRFVRSLDDDATAAFLQLEAEWATLPTLSSFKIQETLKETPPSKQKVSIPTTNTAISSLRMPLSGMAHEDKLATYARLHGKCNGMPVGSPKTGLLHDRKHKLYLPENRTIDDAAVHFV